MTKANAYVKLHRRKMKNFVLTKYFREVWSEIQKVTWPTRIQTIKLTIIVLAVSAAISAYAFGLDLTFQFLVKQLLTR